MRKIYLLRHGQTDMNIQHCLQGRTDTILNNTGRNQAKIAREFLESHNIRPDKIYVSPLKRTRETAEIATGKTVSEMTIAEPLIEMSFGEYEGIPMENLPEGVMDKFFHDPVNYQAPGDGENVMDVIHRTGAFLKQIAEEAPADHDDTVLFVSHGAAIHGMIVALTKMNPEDFWTFDVLNCSVTQLFYDEGRYETLFDGYDN